MAKFKEVYQKKIIKQLMKQFGYKNVMQVPKITKITLNMGVGEAVSDKKILEKAMLDMEKIAGQKPVKTLAKKSIAGFKIREGWPIGCKVVLRQERMYDFLQRLISIAIPRIRDFRGFEIKSFDGRGNYSLGISEQIIFPEIDYDKIDVIRGLDITITTSAKSNEEAAALLREFGFPLKESPQEEEKIKKQGK
jgi:large subunit ribosomal protein L5